MAGLRTMGTHLAMVNGNCDDIFVVAADYLAGQTGLPRGAFRVCPVEAIPKTEAGKTCYGQLNGDG